MQLRFFATTILLFFLIASCHKSDIRDGYIIQKRCEDRIVNGSKVTICFNKLLLDSRCPLKAMCFWQGAAKGIFTFSAGNQKAEFSLSTTTFKPTYIRDTVLFGYRIHLVDIKPYPGEGSFVPRAKIEISQ